MKQSLQNRTQTNVHSGIQYMKTVECTATANTQLLRARCSIVDSLGPLFFISS